jgi:alkylhydroperoxidase family enzyme
MSRLPYVDPAAASEPIREAFAALPVHLNIFRLMANAETCFRPMLRLGGAILAHQALAGRLRELAILRVARLSGAEYEWVQHVPIARSTGVTGRQVEALEAGRIEGEAFAADEQAVLRFTTEVVERVSPSDSTFAAVAKHLSPREIVELVIAIGYYMTIARLMETARIDMDPPAATRVIDAIS